MNKLVIALLISLTSFSISQMNAQQFQVGLKGGINKTYGGEIKGEHSNFTPRRYTEETFTAEGKIGFHGGGWVQVNFGKFFIRPELVYSKLESNFEFPQGPSLFEVEEFSAPLLVGYNIYGPLDIYAGVAYKNIISSTIERLEPLNDPPQVVIQNTPFSAQIGAKVEFGSIGLDVRYDYSLSSAETSSVNFESNTILLFPILTINNATIKDPRLNQIIVSLTLKLWDSENKTRRRKGGSCYF
ncbi:outer membrane beta-barrel protein [Gillisia hiemivivida]|uniref:PorT family protein n=1 Tax=Gillisia hiemivivida TaxID=291190 RepID=A0A5C6ZX54_9FLAO|nr:outer membrane beta-barrel protein [Gillisia hiemivivida]TXD93424.1 PorT family protein [Gillisia hiemivivida]